VDPITQFLGAVVVAGVSGIGGAWLGSKSKVSDSLCGERRGSCLALVTEKLDNIKEAVDEIKEQTSSHMEST
jgi:hypothetical protein